MKKIIFSALIMSFALNLAAQTDRWEGVYDVTVKMGNDPELYYTFVLSSNGDGKTYAGVFTESDEVEGFYSLYNASATSSGDRLKVKVRDGVSYTWSMEEVKDKDETYTLKYTKGGYFLLPLWGKDFKMVKHKRRALPSSFNSLNLKLIGLIGNRSSHLNLKAGRGDYFFANNMYMSEGDLVTEEIERKINGGTLKGQNLELKAYDKKGAFIGRFKGVYDGNVYKGIFTNTKGGSTDFFLWNED